MGEYDDKVKGSCKKRLRKPKRLEFVGWGSKNLIEFLESLGRDTTNRISENDVTAIIMNYIREKNRETLSQNKKSRRKTVVCDKRLRLLFESSKINIVKVRDLVEKHYVENQEDSYYGFLYNSEDDEQQILSQSVKMDKQMNQIVQKPKGTFAAIVRDNIRLLYLRKSLVQELAKAPETFESKVMGTFVRIKNPYQLVQVIGVREGNPIDGHLLKVTNYSYYLEDVPSSVLSDDDFSQEECEELHQRIKNGYAKRLTVVDMEEKVRSLHEDVTKHWIARELVMLQRLIDHANEKGWRRELSQYLEKRELLKSPEEQSRLLHEVPEVVAEEPEPECVDDDMNIENDLIEPNPEAFLEANQRYKEQQPSASPVSSIQETLQNSKLCDGENQPAQTASADDDVKIENDLIEPNPVAPLEAHQRDKNQQPSASPVSSIQEILQNSKLHDGENQTASAGDRDLHEDALELASDRDLHEDAFEPLANDITQDKDYISEVEMIDLDNEPQQDQPNRLEIIVLSDDDEDKDKDNQDDQHYDPKKVMWFYEFPKGKTYGPFSLTDLKTWSDDECFVGIPDFKVWRRGESVKSAVSLTKLIAHIKT